jgi:nicotinic acid mononucleotide adenylyltransferase
MISYDSNENLNFDKNKYIKYKNKYLSYKKKISILSDTKIKQIGGEKKEIIFTYQGAFAPPHFGHFNSARIYLDELVRRYGSGSEENQIRFLFMPTCSKSSKPSLSKEKSLLNPSDYVSEEARATMLGFYVIELKKLYPNVTIEYSDIEYKICRGEYDGLIPNERYVTSTINTLTVLRSVYPEGIIGLGIGIDNGFDISTWSMLDKYVSEPVNLSFILMCDRKPSELAPPIDISSVPHISATVQTYPVDLSIKAFGNIVTDDSTSPSSTLSPNMFFQQKEGLSMEVFDKIIQMITVLDSPDEYSSSAVRQLVKNIYSIAKTYAREDEAKLLAIESIWNLVVNMCGEQVVDYIKTNNIFKS